MVRDIEELPVVVVIIRQRSDLESQGAGSIGSEAVVIRVDIGKAVARRTWTGHRPAGLDRYKLLFKLAGSTYRVSSPRILPQRLGIDHSAAKQQAN